MSDRNSVRLLKRREGQKPIGADITSAQSSLETSKDGITGLAPATASQFATSFLRQVDPKPAATGDVRAKLYEIATGKPFPGEKPVVPPGQGRFCHPYASLLALRQRPGHRHRRLRPATWAIQGKRLLI